MELFLFLHQTLHSLREVNFTECRLTLQKEDRVAILYANLLDKKFEYCEIPSMGINLYNVNMGEKYRCTSLQEFQEVVLLYLYGGYTVFSAGFTQQYSYVNKPPELSNAYYLEADRYEPLRLTVKDRQGNVLFLVPTLVGFDLCLKYTLDVVYKIVL